MLLLTNKQRTVKVNVKQLKIDAQRLLEALEYPDYDLGIQLVGLSVMHKYNKKYRMADKPTDVLSFPFHPNLRAGERIKAENEEEQSLGDIILCPEYIKDDLERWEMEFDERMRVLLVHGVCHLLGYDHIQDIDYRIMHKKEKELLKIITTR